MDVFVYGSLMFPEVIRAVTGVEPEYEEATLEGHARRCVRGERYPAVEAAPGASVSGRVYLGLPVDALAILDEYENVDEGVYVKARLPVRTADGRTLQAQVYVAGPALDGRLEGDWDPAGFSLDEYLDEVVQPYLEWRAARDTAVSGGDPARLWLFRGRDRA